MQRSDHHTGRLEVVDGLRALAVVAVVLFHAFPTYVPGGFIGVDVFFAISGFVIAHRYLQPMVDREISIGGFFLRRIRRLVPAYLVVMLVVAVVATVLMRPRDLVAFGYSLAAQAAYIQNIAFWQQGDYFDDPVMRPLLHTWSLGVEEQFYLTFTLLILIFRRYRKIALALLSAAFVMSIGLGIYISWISPVGAFFLLPFRAWELIAGIGAALVLRRVECLRLPGIFADAICTLGIVALLLASFAFDDGAIFPSVQSGLAVGGTVLICLVQSQIGERLRSWFGLSVIQHFGRISYSWYLWHWPLISFHFIYFQRPMTPAEAIACLLGGYGLGALSYAYVERWGLSTPRLLPRRNALGLLVSFTSSAACAGLLLVGAEGFVDRYPPHERVLLAAQMHQTSRCPVLARLITFNTEVCRLSQASGLGGVLLIGDSHAIMMKETLIDLADRSGVPLYLAKRNCRLVDYGVKRECQSSIWRQIERDIKTLGITRLVTIARMSQDFDAARFDEALKLAVGAGVSVYVQRTMPENSEFDPQTYMVGEWTPKEESSYTRVDYDRDTRGMIDAMWLAAGRYSSVHIIDPLPILCPVKCLVASNGRPIHFDQHHLNSVGAALLRPIYAAVF